MSELGQKLRELRESKGLSIEDVARQTRIKPAFIKAIEEGDFDLLPGEVFAKGFIRNYSLFLGLDPEEMLQLYREERKPVKEAGEEPPSPTEVPLERPSWFGLQIIKGVLLPLLAIFILGLAGWLVYSRYPINLRMPSLVRRSTPSPSPTYTETPTAVPSPTFTPIPSPTPTPVPSPSPTPTKAIVVLNLKGLGRSWLEVKVNDEMAFRGFIYPGDSLVWTGRRIFVKCGNAGGVKAIVNGQDIGVLGEEGEVLNLEWEVGQVEPLPVTPEPTPEVSPTPSPPATPEM